MKSTSFLVATASFAASASAVFFDECFVTQTGTPTEFTYAFSIHDLQTEICDTCSPIFTAAAVANGVTVESYECNETPLVPAIGADVVFAILYNMSTPTAAAEGGEGAFEAFAVALRECLPTVNSFGCPFGNPSP
jgi:hypothetical protein